jgi:hypothetical protein
MKHLSARSEFHALKAELKAQQQPKYKYMITVEQCLLFAEWLHERYKWDKEYKGWIYLHDDSTTTNTTKQLWELYQAFLGKKK